MINRVQFFQSVSGINDPGLMINFYDQFIAAYHLVANSVGSVSVDSYSDTNINFSVSFDSAKDKKDVLAQLQSGIINIYGRPISVNINDSAVRKINITLYR